ncbi:MAG: hypothetical protein J7518_21220 [Nocardioidaceae bacterium]|nr:hypothetical protein [Nocardioidaceae bacterium]
MSRRQGLLWASGAIAALVLVLGVNGTFSSWTTAVVGNSQNTVATTQAVILRETSGAVTCTSSDAPTTNVSTCATINKYGGTATPLTPGTSQSVDVTFTNLGSANASTFQLAPGACSQTPTAGSGTPAAANVCTSGDLTVAISCLPGSTYAAASAWTDLVYAAAAPPTATKTHTATGGDLNAGASWTCRVTTALPAAASVLAQGVTVSQPLTWTLVK